MRKRFSWSSRITWHQSPKADSFLVYLPQSGKTPKWAAREPSTWEHSQRFLPSYFSVFSGRISPQSDAELQMKAAVHRAGIPKTKAKRERSGGQMRRRRRTRGLLAARTCTEVGGRNKLEGRWPGGSRGQSNATHPATGSQAAITFLHRLANFKQSKKYFYIFPSGLLVVTFLVPVIYSFMLLNHARDENRLKLMLEFLFLFHYLKVIEKVEVWLFWNLVSNHYKRIMVKILQLVTFFWGRT